RTPSLEDSLAKKGGLTLARLVDYDDRITDALIDRVYYWTTIRKLCTNRPLGSRGIREDDVARILQTHVILNKDAASAAQHLLQLPALARYLNALPSKEEKKHFQDHFRKYVNIYLPDCPFEVTTTNRYTITTHEAATVARKHIRRNETIKYLTGVQVAMSEAEEKILGVNDFSVVMSSRKKRPSLFLGPARFANHDCNANAKLVTMGHNGMTIVSVRDIDIGEEITAQQRLSTTAIVYEEQEEVYTGTYVCCRKSFFVQASKGSRSIFVTEGLAKDLYHKEGSQHLFNAGPIVPNS
ncbi:hypothetical protein KCU86_g21593, partial [Aureobasidium melanogenum]